MHGSVDSEARNLRSDRVSLSLCVSSQTYIKPYVKYHFRTPSFTNIVEIYMMMRSRIGLDINGNVSLPH